MTDPGARDEASSSYQPDIFVNLFAVLLIIAALLISVGVWRSDDSAAETASAGNSPGPDDMPQRRWHPIFHANDIWILRDGRLSVLNMPWYAMRFADGDKVGRGSAALDDYSTPVEQADPTSVRLDLRIRDALPDPLVAASAAWTEGEFSPPLEDVLGDRQQPPYVFVWEDQAEPFGALVSWLRARQDRYRWTLVPESRPWVRASRESAHFGLETILR